MSIPQPNKGQPIDSSYISNIVSTINYLVTKVASKFSISNVHTPSNGELSVRTSDLVVSATYKVIYNSTSSTTTEQSVTHSFGTTFGYPPVVTVTPMIIDTSLSGKNVFVYVKDVTTSTATIVVRFSTVDTSSVGINVIAVGMPRK